MIVPTILTVIELIFVFLFIFTDAIIHDIYFLNSLQHIAWHFGPFSMVFDLYFFGLFGLGIVILYKKFRHNKDHLVKANLLYMLLVIVVGATPASLLSIILPKLGYFDLDWLGPVTEVIWVPILAYSIFKYRQMDIRAAITEVLAIGMTIVFLINIFVPTPDSTLTNVLTFTIFLILALYLIRSALRENIQTEELNNLNATLNQKVLEQTAEVRHAYDLEKKANRDLAKLNETKDQFILITQHHLRTPVTGLRWELESLLAGTYGKISEPVRKALSDTSTAVNRLTRIVDDFLSITALKIGSNILNITSASIKPLLEDVIDELRINIAEMDIKITYPKDLEGWPPLEIDHGKMREVILIVMENGVRYNHKAGQ